MLGEAMTTKYMMELTKIESCPDKWAKVSLWEERGALLCGCCNSIYYVDNQYVAYIGNTRNVPLAKVVWPATASDFVKE